jgi:hypothetical protein
VSGAPNELGRASVRLLREPLVHFLVLGAALFALYAWRGGSEPSARIVIGAGQLEHLAAGFARTWLRAPTPEELQGLLRDHVREELATREALALGLDRDDTIVRRRLRQKLEFLTEDLVGLAEPSEAELAEYLRAHLEAYELEPRFTFEQVFLSPERRGEALDADAQRLLAELRATPELEDGDPTLLPAGLELAGTSEIDRIFGGDFARALGALAPGDWDGPLRSAFGLHLVRIAAREAGRLPELDEVREAVSRDWFAERKRAALDAFYADLLGRYEVVIEPELPASSAASTGAP